MNLTDKNQMRAFLFFQGKEKEELQRFCEKKGLSTEGDSQELLTRLVEDEAAEEEEDFLPQAISLRSRDERGQPIPRAASAFRKWKKITYEARGNEKLFSLLNDKGESYETMLAWIRCGPLALQTILQEKWYIPRTSEESLVQAIGTRPEDFILSIVQKKDRHGTRFCMLHAEKAA